MSLNFFDWYVIYAMFTLKCDHGHLLGAGTVLLEPIMGIRLAELMSYGDFKMCNWQNLISVIKQTRQCLLIPGLKGLCNIPGWAASIPEL